MRDILQGFTMWIDGSEHGYDTEEIELPMLQPMTQEYRGGGMALGVNQTMNALEPLEVTIKMAGLNADVQKILGMAPCQPLKRLTFRGGVKDTPTGSIKLHLVIVEGRPNYSSRDRWQRGEKSGFEFKVDAISYYRHEIESSIVHETQAWPPKWIVNGIDQIADLNAVLGL